MGGDHIVVNIDLVGHEDAGDGGTIFPELVVPVLEVLVGDLAGDIEDKDAAVGAIIIRRVQAIERLLPSCVPEICDK
jgi:phage-related protein